MDRGITIGNVGTMRDLIPVANRESTPVEMEALASMVVNEVKLPSRKQEFQRSAQCCTLKVADDGYSEMLRDIARKRGWSYLYEKKEGFENV